MSQVYDVPRYKDQALNKLKFFVGMSPTKTTTTLVNGIPFSVPVDIRQQFLNGVFEVLEDVGSVGDEELSEDDMFGRYATSQILMNPSEESLAFSSAVGRIMLSIMEKHRGLDWWADSAASLRIMHGYLSGEYVCRHDQKYWDTKLRAEVAAGDIITAGVASGRHGKNVRDTAIVQTKHAGAGSCRWKEMHNWYAGMSYLRTSSITPENREAHTEMKEGLPYVCLESFSFLETRAGSILGVEEGYRVVNLFFLVYKDAVYVMDHSMLDQLHLVAKRWEGHYAYVENYRRSGHFIDESCKLAVALEKCRSWVCRMLVETNFSDALPRVMKQSYALAQNMLHTHAETLDVGHEEKTRKLTEDIKEVLNLSMQWHELFDSVDLADRQKLDMMTLYYAFPSPDCDLRLLFLKASEVMQSPNKADPEFFEGFLNYCKSYDLCKLLTKAKGRVNHITMDGYTAEDKAWFKRCIKGKLTLPPDEEMGKAWAKDVFPFINTVDTWFWEASDVTRVVPDMNVYRSSMGSRQVKREEHNELLYALGNAPDIVPGVAPKTAFQQVVEGVRKHDCVAGMAAKNENTKPGRKARETWSADAITREVTTAYDRTALPLAVAYEGASIRKADYMVQRGFDKVCSLTDPDSSKKVIIISNDVSGWSPSGDREAWGRHHDYVASIASKPEGLCMSNIWKGIRASLNKRGFINEVELRGGLFQGWTGTIDTMLNLHLSLYSVRVAKRRGILKGEEGAITASLIDDAVQAIELVGDLPEQQAAASGHFATTLEVWKKCAAVIDSVKTLYSSVKFIFLNRLFCEGSEVMCPMKVFSRADKEWNRRFASIHSQFDTVFGSFRAAVIKGADPIVCYVFAVQRCLHLAMMTNPSVKKVDAVRLVNAFFAPRTLGGWGLPHLQAWLTQESKDSLSAYTFTMCSLRDAVPDPSVKDSISKVVGGTLLQEPKNAGLNDVLGSPCAVRAAGVVDPTAAVMSTIKRGMRNKCKSQIFKSMLGCEETEEARDTALQVIKSCVWDASILELVGQCIPSAHASALVDRAYRNELVVQLFPFKLRSVLIRRLKKANYHSIAHTFEIPAREHYIEVTRQCAFDLAEITREIYYDANELHIVNHTLPDYPSAFAARPAGTPGSVSAKAIRVKAGCPSEGQGYSNLYDGRVPGDKLTPGKSKGVYTFTGERMAGMTALRKCFNKAAVIATYVTAKGGSGRVVWDLLTALWGSKGCVPVPSVHFRIDPRSSTKRLSPSLSHVTHELTEYRNTQGCIKVDASGLGRHMGSRSLHVDYMSFVTSIRSIALVEAACTRSIEEASSIALNYAILSGCLPQSSHALCQVMEGHDISPAMDRLRGLVGDGMWGMVLEELKNSELSLDEEDDVAGVEYPAPSARPSEGVLRTTQGYIATLLLSEVPVPASASRTTAVIRVAGDEHGLGRIERADRVLKRYLTMVGTTQALLCTMLELTLRMFPNKMNLPVIQAQATCCTQVMESEFPEWASHYVPMVKWARGRCNKLSNEIVASLFPNGQRWEKGRTALTFLSTREDEGSLQVATMLYRTANGRPMNSASYSATSALGLKHIARCWNVAHIVRRGERARRGVFVQSEIYHALHIHAKSSSSRSELCNAILQGIISAATSLSRDFRNMKASPAVNSEDRLAGFMEEAASVPIPAGEAARGNADGPETQQFRRDVTDLIYRLDPDGIKRHNAYFVDNVCTDIYMSNNTQALVDDAEPVVVGQPPSAQLEPKFEVWDNPEMQIEDPDVDSEPENSEEESNLVKATTAFGDCIPMDECVKILAGELDYDPDPMISRDEMDYFLDAKRNWEGTQAGGVDEAEV